MNILVTGGAGFIGSHTVEALLHQGHRVIVIDNLDKFYAEEIKIKNVLESTNKTEYFQEIIQKEGQSRYQKMIECTTAKNYQLYINDICDLSALENIFKEENLDGIIHLAGLAGVRPSIEVPLRYEQVNIQGTLHLLELCKKYQVKKFIQASSSSVYGNCKETPFQEDARLDFPISPYAASKKSCELFGHVYANLYHIDMIQLRFFTVYGERQRPDLAIHKFIAAIEEDREITLFGDGSSSRDYTYIRDIVQGICLSLDYLVKHHTVFEIINLGSARKISLLAMVQTIEKVLDKKAKIRFEGMQQGDVDQTFASLEKAKALLDYSVTTSFQEGIQNFVNWYQRKEK